MRIALRTSGGRGEYEAAGVDEKRRVHDVLDRPIVIEMLPGVRIHTGNRIKKVQGKPRVRLENIKSDKHLYLILAAVLLLPKPKREIGITPAGKLQIYENNFSVSSIPFDLVEINLNELVICPTQLLLSNSSSVTVRLDVVERMRIILTAWSVAENAPDSPIRTILLAHKNAFYEDSIIDLTIAAQSLRLNNPELDDPLIYALRQLGAPGLEDFTWMGVHSIENEEAQVLGEVNLDDAREVARNRIKKWRQVAERGTEGKKFSEAVKSAYNNTCLISGYRLPKTDFTGASGVDAAHILPWAEYNINSIQNGICLNKLAHWAFDAGIIKISPQPNDQYIVSITNTALHAEQIGQIDLEIFRPYEGNISSSLLPKDKASWPDSSFLRVYNEALNL